MEWGGGRNGGEGWRGTPGAARVLVQREKWWGVTWNAQEIRSVRGVSPHAFWMRWGDAGTPVSFGPCSWAGRRARSGQPAPAPASRSWTPRPASRRVTPQRRYEYV